MANLNSGDVTAYIQNLVSEVAENRRKSDIKDKYIEENSDTMEKQGSVTKSPEHLD